VDLLEDLVDVGRVGLDPLLGPLLTTVSLGSRGLCGLVVSRVQEWSEEEKETYLCGSLGGGSRGLGSLRRGSLGSDRGLGGLGVSTGQREVRSSRRTIVMELVGGKR
jgi:hypothetical protein